MKRKALLANPSIGVFDYAEVRVMSMFVVHRRYVEFPARRHDQIKVWKIEIVVET